MEAPPGREGGCGSPGLSGSCGKFLFFYLDGGDLDASFLLTYEHAYTILHTFMFKKRE